MQVLIMHVPGLAEGGGVPRGGEVAELRSSLARLRSRATLADVALLLASVRRGNLS